MVARDAVNRSSPSPVSARKFCQATLSGSKSFNAELFVVVFFCMCEIARALAVVTQCPSSSSSSKQTWTVRSHICVQFSDARGAAEIALNLSIYIRWDVSKWRHNLCGPYHASHFPLNSVRTRPSFSCGAINTPVCVCVASCVCVFSTGP